MHARQTWLRWASRHWQMTWLLPPGRPSLTQEAGSKALAKSLARPRPRPSHTSPNLYNGSAVPQRRRQRPSQKAKPASSSPPRPPPSPFLESISPAIRGARAAASKLLPLTGWMDGRSTPRFHAITHDKAGGVSRYVDLPSAVLPGRILSGHPLRATSLLLSPPAAALHPPFQLDRSILWRTSFTQRGGERKSDRQSLRGENCRPPADPMKMLRQANDWLAD